MRNIGNMKKRLVRVHNKMNKDITSTTKQKRITALIDRLLSRKVWTGRAYQ